MNSAYEAALNSVAVFERPGTGLVRAAGPDAAAFLHNIASQDIKTIALGEAKPAFFLDHRAKVLHRVLVVRENEASFLLMTDTGRGPALFKHLDKFLISERVELADISGDHQHFHIVGPKAATVLGSAFKSPAFELDLLKHETISETTIVHSDMLRLPGFDVLVSTGMAKRFLGQLTGVPQGDADTWNVLRIEAGVPVFGQDFDETRFVLELPDALAGISYTKGCFPGQEPIVMSRDRAGFVNRSFTAFAVHAKQGSGRIAPYKLLNFPECKDEVGQVTSQALSGRRFGAIALGYIRRGYQEPGTALADDGGCAAWVLGWPPRLDLKTEPLS